jgi:hypothetical protein
LISLGLVSALAGGGAVLAQLEGGDRGIPPIDSTSNFEVLGVEVDVTAKNAQEARLEGWRRAQALGWRMLWARSTRRPIAQAPNLPESVLNGIVSGIVVEQEQIGPTRYIARLGVLFDRARTGGMLGVQGLARRSAPFLIIPVMTTGGTPYTFEFRNEWQRAWAQFRTANSPVDYVRTSGSGADPMLLNLGQSRRRGRGWWRMLLDQYGAADVLVAEVMLSRLYPGGPARGQFTARFGPDGRIIGQFELRANSSAELPRMMDEGVRRMDALYVRALGAGLLVPDPTLIIEQPELLEPLEPLEEVEDTPVERPNIAAAPATIGGATGFTIQVATPDEAAVSQAEVGVASVGGVTSALTVSRAAGGTSVIRVTYAGDPAGLQAALQGAGWQVTQTGPNSVRISR